MKRAVIRSGGVVALVVAGIAAPAHAQIIAEPVAPHPDPSLFARGWFVEAEAGAAIPIGDASTALGVGAALGARAGYDLWRFLAVQVHASGSTHTVDLAGGPQAAQLVQIVKVAAELKLTVPLGAWSIFAQGGGGRARLSTNVLGTAGLTTAGVRLSNVYGGGLGVDYHSRSRHFSCGVVGGFDKLDRIATTGMAAAAAYVRYTF